MKDKAFLTFGGYLVEKNDKLLMDQGFLVHRFHRFSQIRFTENVSAVLQTMLCYLSTDSEVPHGGNADFYRLFY